MKKNIITGKIVNQIEAKCCIAGDMNTQTKIKEKL